jgi:hypothetical protein
MVVALKQHCVQEKLHPKSCKYQVDDQLERFRNLGSPWLKSKAVPLPTDPKRKR